MSEIGHKCGVFGVYGRPDASALTALGLHALQHRGQEACGIASYDRANGCFHTERHMGLVGDSFGEGAQAMKSLVGAAAIGHNRYSTSGTVAVRNIQPLFADLSRGGFAIAHNGNLTNARRLRRDLVDQGAIFQSTTDTEVILQLIARSTREQLVGRILNALNQVQGGYALVGLSGKKMIGARDPWGLRSLVIGRVEDAFVLASESCALDAVGASLVREVEHGELVVFSADADMKSYFLRRQPTSTPCVFEYVYFARPDSVMHGRSVYDTRLAFGARLAAEHPVAGADIVCPAPDGGVPAAIGYADAFGLSFQFGIIRNHYVGRTFIEPTDLRRRSSVSRKHAANRSQLQGRSVVLVDDSIVRGITSARIVQMVRAAGARQVHLRVASPPIRHPDFYGIDMPSESELLANAMSIGQMREHLGVDSLAFLSLEGFYAALGEKSRDPDRPQFADHCFTGQYPAPLDDFRANLASKELQLSLLDDV